MARRKRKVSSGEEKASPTPTRAPNVGTGLKPLLEAALQKRAANPSPGGGPRKSGGGGRRPKPGHSVPVTQPPPGPLPPERVPTTDPPDRPREEPSPPRSATELRWLNDAYEGVTPLARAARARQRRLAERRATPSEPADAGAFARSSSADAAARARLHALVGEGTRFSIDMHEDGFVSARREGIGEKELRPMRGPGFHPEATLDLHGVRRGDVAARVSSFVRTERRRGSRYLLVVHGKGLHSDNGHGVLGDAVFEALTRGGAAPLVRALCTPHEQHGGRGATAVAID